LSDVKPRTNAINSFSGVIPGKETPIVHILPRMTRAKFQQARTALLWRSLAVLALAVTPIPLYAQQTADSPWENAVSVLQTAFTGPIARGLSLVAIVVGGLMFAYGEGQSKRTMAGILFGVGMAIGAVNFMAWLFP
jgi:type IV secretory pathway VirB2 component (pilin)